MNTQRILAALLLLANAALVTFWLRGPTWGRPSLPFVWPDVALVQLLAALPLAGALAVLLRRGLPDLLLLALALLLAGVGGYLLSAMEKADLPGSLIVLPTALSITLLLVMTVDARSTAGQEWPWIALGLVILILPPWAYTYSRCRHDVSQVEEWLQQSRYGEAQPLVHRVLLLNPQAELSGQSLTRVAGDLNRTVRLLEAEAADPLAEDASPEVRLRRARALAMLGHSDQALAALQPLEGAEADSLRATIYETREQWSEGLATYRAAQNAWRERPTSPEREAGLVQAATGIAYCLRKQGRYLEAEAAYLEVLSLAPTADTHFLLAQFYEDGQQAEKAHHHARQAIRLAPTQYRVPGEKLIAKLTTSHFGCFQVFRAEAARSRSPFLGR
jgi:tetratricopeptide (TPR) repeat protein